MATAEIKTFRIVNGDNFAGDYPDESFVAIGIPSQELAQLAADGMNSKSGLESRRFYFVVPHVETVYRLQPGFEP